MLSSNENEDVRPPTKTKTHNENEDPLRKQRPPLTKRKTHHENEDTLLKQVQKRLVLLLCGQRLCS